MHHAKSSQTRQHAVVIGGGLAGLLAARVLADHFESVTLIERDGVATEAKARKGVPQGHHVHGLLAKGQEILAALFPDLVPALVAGGAVPLDMGRDFRWHHFGAWKARFDSGIGGILFTRPYLEWHVAERVCARPNVRVINAAAEGLAVAPDGGRVTGVRIQSPGGAVRVLSADLIVDAGGRGSHAPQWLEAIGYAKPAESTVKIDLMYASRLYRPGPEARDWKALVVTSRAPAKKMTAIFAVEGGRWLVTLGGVHGECPPTDEAGYIEFARTLVVPDAYRAIASAEPLTPIATYKIPRNIRRHYDRLRRFPERFLVMGDAFCSFNPIYGQGMTVSAREAMALDDVLRERVEHGAGLDGVAALFHGKIAHIVDAAWRPTAGEDFRHAETVGERPPAMRLLHWYTGRMHERCAHDTSLALAFYRVMHMIDPPTALFRPSVIARVLRRHPAAADRDAGRAADIGPSATPAVAPVRNTRSVGR
jgi:2-polyprenyl-6-methoxyphenol hydroxylase-like FAD-dependent oxidoreductase